MALFLGIYRREGRRPVQVAYTLLSRSGDGPLYVAFACLLLACGISWGPSFVTCGLLGFGLQLPLYKFIKSRCRRPRPFERHAGVIRRIQPPDAWSFPSGHTASAFLVATLLTAFCPPAALPAYGWASLVGMSRVYLGVHYPTDVLAGAALGIGTGLLVSLGC